MAISKLKNYKDIVFCGSESINVFPIASKSWKCGPALLYISKHKS